VRDVFGAFEARMRSLWVRIHPSSVAGFPRKLRRKRLAERSDPGPIPRSFFLVLLDLLLAQGFMPILTVMTGYDERQVITFTAISTGCSKA